jgi:hypothetical protein
MPTKEIELNPYISPRMFRDLLTLRTERIKDLCEQLLKMDYDWKRCDRHDDTSRRPVTEIILEMISEPSLEAFIEILGNMEDDGEICNKCTWPCNISLIDKIFRVDESSNVWRRLRYEEDD